MFNAMNETALVARLTKCQNHPKFQEQDIMSFQLMFATSAADLERRVSFYEKQIAPASGLKLDPAKIAAAQASHAAVKAHLRWL